MKKGSTIFKCWLVAAWIFALIRSTAIAADASYTFSVDATSIPIDYVPPLIVSVTGTFQLSISSFSYLTVTCSGPVSACSGLDGDTFPILQSIEKLNGGNLLTPAGILYQILFEGYDDLGLMEGYDDLGLMLQFTIPFGDTLFDFMDGTIVQFRVFGDYGTLFGGGGLGTISEVSETPEPSTWAMMLIGFAGLGLASYWARKRAVAAA